MTRRSCNCNEFQDSGHTEECNEHYAKLNPKQKGGPTEKQRAAQIRNDKIRRLRGIAAQARSIEMPQADKNRILMGIDGALAYYKADSESEHRRKIFETINNP